MTVDDAVLRHRAQGAPDLDGAGLWELTVVNAPADLSVVDAVAFVGREARIDELSDVRDDEHDARVAVLLPCHNEAVTIGEVVADFRRALPTADIYVYDNASTDRTAAVAAAAGAIVRSVPSRGKGNVVRRMFSEVEASIYVLADGDGTYDASAAPRLIQRLRSHNLEMVIGRRVEVSESGLAYRRGHKVGNYLLNTSVHWLFGDGPNDMLSGYRVFTRRFVKSFPATSSGFESETEMTIYALDICAAFEEVPVNYCGRPAASKSKLRTIPDGLRILRFILRLCREHRPLRFFGVPAALCALAAIAALAAAAGHPAFPEWSNAAEVAWSFVCMAAFFLVAGVIVESVSRSRREVKRALFLAIPQVHPTPPSEQERSTPFPPDPRRGALGR
jgi:Glycosyl transferase family 2